MERALNLRWLAAEHTLIFPGRGGVQATGVWCPPMLYVAYYYAARGILLSDSQGAAAAATNPPCRKLSFSDEGCRNYSLQKN